MKQGDIYSRQKCPECGASFVHDPKLRALKCTTHPKQRATGGFYVKFGRAINKRFPDYAHAEQFLAGVRFKSFEGTLDAKDYSADQPYSFGKLIDLFLKEKEKHASLGGIRRHMRDALRALGDVNVKTIRAVDIKRFLQGLGVSDKTRANYRATLNNFFTKFLVEEEIVDTPLKLPKVSYELGYRNITTPEVQDSIVDELPNVDGNPKVAFAVDLLRTYLSLRPGDLLRLTEADVTEEALICWHPTKAKNRRKVVRLLPEHGETVLKLKAQFPALPGVKFFRHHGGVHGVRAGREWGGKYLYKKWIKACKLAGVEGLDLYGGTRHTMTTALAIEVGRAGAREATGHETNKAFDRYCQAQELTALNMARVVRGLHHQRTTGSAPPKASNPAKLLK